MTKKSDFDSVSDPLSCSITELIEAGYKAEKSIIEQSEEDAIAKVLAVTDQGDMILFGLAFADDEEKKQAQAVLKLIFAVHNVQRYVFTSEAWTVEVEADKDREADEVIDEALRDFKVSEHPDREERLVIVGVEAHRVALADATITRKGKRKTVGPLIQRAETGTRGGPFTNLLPPEHIPVLDPDKRPAMMERLGLAGVGHIIGGNHLH